MYDLLQAGKLRGAELGQGAGVHHYGQAGAAAESDAHHARPARERRHHTSAGGHQATR